MHRLVYIHARSIQYHDQRAVIGAKQRLFFVIQLERFFIFKKSVKLMLPNIFYFSQLSI